MARTLGFGMGINPPPQRTGRAIPNSPGMGTQPPGPWGGRSGGPVTITPPNVGTINPETPTQVTLPPERDGYYTPDNPRYGEGRIPSPNGGPYTKEPPGIGGPGFLRSREMPARFNPASNSGQLAAILNSGQPVPPEWRQQVLAMLQGW